MAKSKASGPVENAVRFRFNHYCNWPGAMGGPGEVREIPAELAARLAARKGGEIVGDDVPLTDSDPFVAVAPEDEQEPEAS